MNCASRTDVTLALLSRTLEQQREWIDGHTDLRALHMVIRYDRKTGKPGLDFRPQLETV